MKIALLCLLVFTGWTVLIVAAVVGWRMLEVLMGRKPANGFSSGIEHGTDLYWRVNRAHVNAIETLAVFAAVVLTGAVAGVDGDGFAMAAQVVVVGRIVQTTAHLASGKAMVVQLRFVAFLTQLGAIVALIAFVAQRLLG